MKNIVPILLFGALSATVLAAGDHASGHGSEQTPHNHDMPKMPHGGHAMHGKGGAGMHDTAAGRPGDPAKVSRTIEVTMTDMRFTPDRIRAKAGETVRFFVRNKGFLLGVLRVDVLVDTPLGVVTLPVGAVPAGQSWTPTLPTPFLANLLALLGRNGETGIAFRFTSMLGGNFQIDDVYVDPYRSA